MWVAQSSSNSESGCNEASCSRASAVRIFAAHRRAAVGQTDAVEHHRRLCAPPKYSGEGCGFEDGCGGGRYSECGMAGEENVAHVDE